MSLLRIFDKESNKEARVAVLDFFGSPPQVITQTESEVFENILEYSKIYMSKDDPIPFELKLSVGSRRISESKWVNLDDNEWVKKGVQNGDIATMYVKIS